jgi:hypothetical protein
LKALFFFVCSACSGIGLAVGPVCGVFFVLFRKCFCLLTRNPKKGIVLGFTISPVPLAWFVAALTGAGIALLNFIMVLLFVKESPAFLSGAKNRKMRRICVKWSEMSAATVRSIVVVLVTTFIGATAFILLESVVPLLLIDVYLYKPWQLIVIFAGFMVSSIVLQVKMFCFEKTTVCFGCLFCFHRCLFSDVW